MPEDLYSTISRPMRYLVDSDWIADYLVGKQEAVTLLDRLVSDGIGVSLITLGEIYEGSYYGRDPKRSEAGFRQFLTGVRVLPLTRPIIQRFATTRRFLSHPFESQNVVHERGRDRLPVPDSE